MRIRWTSARDARHGPARRPQRRGHGFTLVEVLVALSIMAVVATLTWRGIDGMTRAREVSQASLDRSLRLGTVLAQWERDLQAVQNGMGVPALSFDGASLRLARDADGGVQLVVWTLRDGSLFRWAAAPLKQATELRETWLRSQQLMGDEPGTLKVLENVTAWQVYFYRGNGWSNAQSTGDRATTPGAPPTPQGGTPPPADPGEQIPAGVRLLVTLPAGTLTRDVLMNGPGY